MEKISNSFLYVGAAVIIIIIAVSGLVYFSLPSSTNNPGSVSKPQETITLYTTTSTDNSGLLDYLHPLMNVDTNITVNVVAVGTGAALEAARQGLADVVMVHARSLEDQFIAEGYGIHRVSLMHNDFVLVGSSSDPAHVMGMTNATQVFQKLYANRDKITFVSRGDNSGTNVKELELWNASGIAIDSNSATWASANPWYQESGSGMSKTLTTASTKGAYTLTDRATFLFMNNSLNLEILAQNPTGDPNWQNPYGVILVNPAKFSNVNIKFDVAKEYVQWLISSKGQAEINNYKINGKQVFFADFDIYKSQMSSSELNFWGLK